MTPEQVADIAETAADRALKKFFVALGVDASDAQSMLAMQADFRHVRRWREATEAVPKYGLRAAITAVVTGLVGYLMVSYGWKAV